MHRIIYYYQTFIPLSLVLFANPYVTHIHLSSIHFGVNNDNIPYIHLNDYPPNNSKFDVVWEDLHPWKFKMPVMALPRFARFWTNNF